MRPKIISTIIFLAIMLIGYLPSSAQFGQPAKEKKDEFRTKKRLFVGGGCGFGISSNSTYVGIYPVLGYRLSPSFDVGTRLNYTYNHYEDPYTDRSYSFNDYGVGVFSRYYFFFFNNLFAHAEYEALNFEYIDSRNWVSSLFVGGGYRQWIGQNAFMGITILWNLLETADSPYGNPIYRIGVGVGI